VGDILGLSTEQANAFTQAQVGAMQWWQYWAWLRALD